MSSSEDQVVESSVDGGEHVRCAVASNDQDNGTCLLGHFDLSHLQDIHQEALSKLLTEYEDVFSKGQGDIETTTAVEHSILTKDVSPIKQLYRRVPQALREEVDRGEVNVRVWHSESFC